MKNISKVAPISRQILSNEVAAVGFATASKSEQGEWRETTDGSSLTSRTGQATGREAESQSGSYLRTSNHHHFSIDDREE